MSSIARAFPIARVRRWVPPAPGMTPSRISGWPKLASSAATIMSQAIASSQPPPSAKPRTAAMSGSPMARDALPRPSNRHRSRQRRRRLRFELTDIGPGRERPIARAGDDDRPAGRVGIERFRAPSASSSRSAKLRALSASGRWRVTSATPGQHVRGRRRCRCRGRELDPDEAGRRLPGAAVRSRAVAALAALRGRSTVRSWSRRPRGVFRQYPRTGKRRRPSPARPRARGRSPVPGRSRAGSGRLPASRRRRARRRGRRGRRSA